MKLGKIKEAEKCFDEALKLNPNNEYAKKGKELIYKMTKSIPYLK